MKKLSREKLDWIERQNKRRMRQRARKNRKKRTCISFNSPSMQISSINKGHTHTFSLVAPENFSLLDHTDETLQYFRHVKDCIRKAVPGDSLFFDLSSIKSASPDAFLYIIALIHNNRKLNSLQITCHGNEPREEEPRKTLIRAGFFHYVSSKAFHPRESDDALLRIYRGFVPDPTYAGKLCDFVHKRTSHEVDRSQTKRLYAMLIELMSNTKQHAFHVDNQYDLAFLNWYAYAEDLGDFVRFVFLDTGFGIPSTIRKSFFEHIPLLSSDARFIASALRGDFRTDTGQKHRGKGLPEIYDSVKKGIIRSLTIFSGRGLCLTNEKNEIVEKTLSSVFNGTLFSWTIMKRRANNDRNQCS